MNAGNVSKLAVIGTSVESYSLSPLIHTYWINKYKIDASYTAINVAEDALEAFISTMPYNGFLGCNLTVPHKEKAIAVLARLGGVIDPVARVIGAVNTIKVMTDTALQATNTDYYGFSKTLDLQRIYAKTLIIGAGGATKAICKCLLDARYRGELIFKSITLVNRTRQKAEALAKEAHDARIRVIDWSEVSAALVDVDLFVNTTSLGMQAHPPLVISLAGLPAKALVQDIIYNPTETPLLHQARLQGNQAINGLDMLLYQAQLAFNTWFPECNPEVTDELRHLVMAKLA